LLIPVTLPPWRLMLAARPIRTGSQYYEVIKQGIAGIGLDASKFGSHSMRSGWISTAASNGASVWKMKEISRHKSTDVLAGYIREAELFHQHASVGMY
jgi:hypothetical protein